MTRLISPRGWRCKSNGWSWHEGYDFVYDQGDIYAYFPMQVLRVKRDHAGYLTGYGNAIIGRILSRFVHPSLTLDVIYAHLGRIEVAAGDMVAVNQIIAQQGATHDGKFPRMSPHLHLAVRRRGREARDAWRLPYGQADIPGIWIAVAERVGSARIDCSARSVQNTLGVEVAPHARVALAIGNGPAPGHSHRGPYGSRPQR